MFSSNNYQETYEDFQHQLMQGILEPHLLHPTLLITAVVIATQLKLFSVFQWLYYPVIEVNQMIKTTRSIYSYITITSTVT